MPAWTIPNTSDGFSHPSLGNRVTKTQTLASDPDALFVVTGKVAITLWTGEVTTVLATTTTLTLRVATTNEALCGATTITSDADGTMYLVTGDTGAILNGSDAPTTRVAQGSGVPVTPIIIGLSGDSLTIEADLNAAGTGEIEWILYYLPLEPGAMVAAAA